MVGYRWIEFGGKVKGVCVVVFGVKIRSVDVVEYLVEGKKRSGYYLVQYDDGSLNYAPKKCLTFFVARNY